MLGGPQGGLQGGPAIPSPAEQLSGHGLGGAAASIFDVDPFTDKSCAHHNTGVYCKATTTPGVELFKSVQIAINDASNALTAVASQLEGGLAPLQEDGVIGPATATRATQLLDAVGPHGKAQPWLEDPRSQTPKLMAPLLASQPQMAIETFQEIAQTLRRMGPVQAPSQPTVQVMQPAVEASRASAQMLPTGIETPKTFWTRRNKIIVGATVGGVFMLSALIWWLLKRS